MKVIIVTETELKSLGDGINRDFLELCLKHNLIPDILDQPGQFPHPAQGLYRKIHFTLHRWLNEVGSTTRVETMDTDIMKQRSRDLRSADIGLITERWINEDVDQTLKEKALSSVSSALTGEIERAAFSTGYLIARIELRKELEKYLNDPAKY